MNNKRQSLLVSFLLLALVLASCLPAGPSEEMVSTEYAKLAKTATQNAMASQVARIQTEIVRMTIGPEAATQTQAAVIPVSEEESPTPEPENTETKTPWPSMTPWPSFTPRPSSTPYRSPVPVSSSTPSVICNRAGDVEDISIPDGTAINSGTKFTKTWRLTNTGACTWNSDYDLVFSSGDRIGGSSVSLDETVSPGETIDVSVTLTAPDNLGTYVGYWKLRSANGAVFGIGPFGQDPFWVEIRVLAPISGNFNIASHYCNLEWRSAAGILPCPGSTGDSEGFVVKLDNPRLQDGLIYDEESLLTNPRMVDNGYIRGKLPPYKVKAGDYFAATLACQYKHHDCQVHFRLDYQINNGKITNYDIWDLSYTDDPLDIMVDLSSLAGKSVNFILTVYDNGVSKDDRAIWMHPRLVRPAQTATPSRTFTPSLTRTPTKTRTPSLTFTPSKTRTPTNTRTPTSTRTPTRTPTPSKTTAPTDTFTPTNTDTSTPTPTDTTVPSP